MILLVPAYGRLYDTIEEAEKAWLSGIDFRIFKGPYCSLRDFELLKGMGHSIVLSTDFTFKLTKILCNGV